jgi:hypothetical protein
MLIKLPNGDLIESSDVSSLKAKQATFVPDRVVLEMFDGDAVTLECQEFEEAKALRDAIADGVDAAGECVLDMIEGEPDDAHTGPVVIDCPHCGEEVEVVASEDDLDAPGTT